jgi:hypothetical protein
MIRIQPAGALPMQALAELCHLTAFQLASPCEGYEMFCNPANKLTTIMQYVIACAEAGDILEEEQRMDGRASRMAGEDVASMALLGLIVCKVSRTKSPEDTLTALREAIQDLQSLRKPRL